MSWSSLTEMSRFRATLSLALLLIAVRAGAQPANPAPVDLPPPFPRANATKLLETDRIVVWNIVWPKGQPTALHRHVYDQVGTYYARGGRTITTPDGAARQAMTEAGSISTTRKGTTHVEEGNTDPPLRAVFIELKRDTPAAPNGGDAVPPRPGARQAYDDARVRVWDVADAQGFDVVSAGAPGGTVVVYLGEGRVRLTGKDGQAREMPVAPGTMRYLPAGASERESVLAGAPRVMIFELK